MRKYIPFIVHWLFNSVVIFLVGLLFPLDVVLGNSWLNSFLAALMTGIFITFIAHIVKEVIKLLGFKLNGRMIRFVLYFATNTVGIWILARIPGISGIGISGYYWAIGLGLILNVFQWGVRQGLKTASL